MKNLKNRSEALALSALFALFRTLPLDTASALGGRLARAIGPMLSAHKTARNNLAMALPELSPQDTKTLLSSMWDNLGRVAAELPHLPGDTLYNRVTIEGLHNLPAPNEPVIFFSAHLGNWELLSPIAHRHGIPLSLIYRRANNPYVDKIITAIRGTQTGALLPKGHNGALRLARLLKAGGSLAVLSDQKLNEGIPVPFFGRDAMTAPAIAKFALRHNMKLIPAKVIRTDGCHFTATLYPPLQYETTGDTDRDILAIMTQVNNTLESWIRHTPAQWFWVHKRWPKDAR
jgi:KDO2-lipid IV(A) lauroyltransferase